MAKRFIDTAIFEKEFVSSLEAPYKLLFVYFITKCDHAGVIDKHALKLASFLLDHEYDVKDVSKLFAGKVLDLGTKWFMPAFIKFQYGSLNDKNRAQNSVIQILKSHNIDPSTLELKTKNKPLISPLQGGTDKDKVKVKDKGTDKDKEKENLPHGEKFSEAWEEWKKFRIEKRAKLTPSTMKSQLKKFSSMTEQEAILTIQQSIENGWQGLFPEKIVGEKQKTDEFNNSQGQKIKYF